MGAKIIPKLGNSGGKNHVARWNDSIKGKPHPGINGHIGQTVLYLSVLLETILENITRGILGSI